MTLNNSLNCNINVSATPDHVAAQFATDFADCVARSTGPVCVSLSGGSTPRLLFEHWTANYQSLDWKRVHFFWGDERCVAPDDPESNYGVANELFFQPTGILPTHIHRICGENNPEQEVLRYGQEILQHVPLKDGLPVFDIMILGMGSDGHVASIFPDQMPLMQSNEITALARHPETGQKRITLTGPVLRRSQRIDFLITGSSKAKIIAAILGQQSAADVWPATDFCRLSSTTLYLDRAAVETNG